MAKFTPHQTGTNAGCGSIASCSARTLSAIRSFVRLKRALPLGSVARTFSLLPSAVNHAAVMFQSENLGSLGVNGIGEPGVTEWAAGNYTINLNISTANTNITWTETYICRINHTCGGGTTVGSLTGQSISCGTTGVKQMVVSGAASSGDENDHVYIVLVFSNANIMATQSTQFLPNKLITMPINIPDFRGMRGCGT